MLDDIFAASDLIGWVERIRMCDSDRGAIGIVEQLLDAGWDKGFAEGQEAGPESGPPTPEATEPKEDCDETVAQQE